jgi:hypothetical protein
VSCSHHQIFFKNIFTALADVAIFFLHVSPLLLNVSRQGDKSLSDGQWTAHNLADLLNERDEWLGNNCGTFLCIFCGVGTALINSS